MFKNLHGILKIIIDLAQFIWCYKRKVIALCNQIKEDINCTYMCCITCSHNFVRLQVQWNYRTNWRIYNMHAPEWSHDMNYRPRRKDHLKYHEETLSFLCCFVSTISFIFFLLGALEQSGSVVLAYSYKTEVYFICFGVIWVTQKI